MTRTVVGRGKSLLCDPLGRGKRAEGERKKKGEHNKWDGKNKELNRTGIDLV